MKFRAKLVVTPYNWFPLYMDFFEYANDHMQDKNVVLTNTDVVFDETLELIDVTNQNFANHKEGKVLAVVPPPDGTGGDSRYRDAFTEQPEEDRLCQNTPRCTLGLYGGWDLGGASWDAYLFRPHFPKA